MNRVDLVGRLTKDPELRYIPGSGTAVTKVTVAVDDYDYKNKQKSAQFIPVTVWGKAAESLAQYMSKGSQISVTGKIRIYSYDAKDGTKRYAFEVVADMNGGIKYLSKPTGNGGNFNNGGNQGYNNQGYNNNNGSYGNNNGGYNNNVGYGNTNRSYNNNNGGFADGGYNGGYAASQNNTQSPVESDPFAGAFGGFGDDFTPIDDGDIPF